VLPQPLIKNSLRQYLEHLSFCLKEVLIIGNFIHWHFEVRVGDERFFPDPAMGAVDSGS
jgi:hypothetical protein